MNIHTRLPPPSRWIEGLRMAKRAGSWREIVAAQMRSGGGAAMVVLLALCAIYLAEHGLFEADRPSQNVDAPRSSRVDKIHLSEDASTAIFAPVELDARLDWRMGALGVMLTWEPTDNEIRIYRIPGGKSNYVVAEGASGQLFDADVVPGAIHYYVACAHVRGDEYCSDPISYEVPRQIWR